MKHPHLKAIITIAFLATTSLTTLGRQCLAQEIYIGGQLGRTSISEDSYFELANSNKQFENTALNYGLLTGISLASGWNIEAGIVKQQAFKTKEATSNQLSIESLCAQIFLKQHFALGNNFRWYLKEGIGLVNVEQHFNNAQSSQKNKDNKLILSGTIGLQKNFLHHDNRFLFFTEWNYSGYKLTSSLKKHTIRYNNIAAGILWKF